MCKRSPFTETVRWVNSCCVLPLSAAAKVTPRVALAKTSVEAISAGGANEPAIPRKTVRRLHEVRLEKCFASYEGFILHLSRLEILQMSEWSGLRMQAKLGHKLTTLPHERRRKQRSNRIKGSLLRNWWAHKAVAEPRQLYPHVSTSSKTFLAEDLARCTKTTSARGPKDGVIGRPSLWIAEDFRCCASG